jgi:hypothetical protein
MEMAGPSKCPRNAAEADEWIAMSRAGTRSVGGKAHRACTNYNLGLITTLRAKPLGGLPQQLLAFKRLALEPLPLLQLPNGREAADGLGDFVTSCRAAAQAVPGDGRRLHRSAKTFFSMPSVDPAGRETMGLRRDVVAE